MFSLLFVLACNSNPAPEVAPETAPEVAPEAPEAAADPVQEGSEEAAAMAEEANALPTLPESGWAEYGADFTLTEVMPVATLMASPEDYVGQTVLVEGEVADVCQKMGCWMVIGHQDQTMRIMMKDHSFSVAVDGAGGNCQIEGVVNKVEVDPEMVEHLESESVNVEAMPERQATGSVTYQLEASSVRMRRAG